MTEKGFSKKSGSGSGFCLLLYKYQPYFNKLSWHLAFFYV
ncbi:MAG: hypothetical protein GAK29_04489 [Acinetobacter bereziniae]|uniref:Uncharacterized protein n=1 Tax=Acinetobacter bereziniae TaxID=106648 RepID=A0A833TU67_ACIBZ|nr:MAG: hypothetical protein GAK29_04489 [Acinetobacter bereziniae]